MRSVFLLLCTALLARADDRAFFEQQVQPVLREYCLKCHSTEKQKGDLDLETFRSLEEVRRRPKVWQSVAEQLADHEMPPKEKPQPSAEEMARLTGWTQRVLMDLAREHAGDPGPVVLRRLSNTEYTYTLRDLTGVETLEPAKEFPVDGAAGEGFTNTGQALVMSPALLSKYLVAAKEVASHAVLLPDGLRFSSKTMRREWTDEVLAQIRALYRQYTAPGGENSVNLQGVVFQTNGGGRLPLEKYFAALLRERAGEKADAALSPKYLATLRAALEGTEPSLLLQGLREHWRTAKPEDAPALAAEVAAWQKVLWKFNPVGALGVPGGPMQWMEPVTPKAVALGLPINLEGEELEHAATEVRALFPAALCYEKIVPTDAVITLTLIHREDEPLVRLMLDDAQKAKLDRLWDELHFIDQDALQQVDSFAQLLEFASQDGNPKIFEPLRGPINERAAAFRQRLVESQPAQLEAVLEFAARAYRHPLSAGESGELRKLYARLRAEELPAEEALRLTLARVLISSAFLYRAETPGPEAAPVPVSDLELATRLSYFLWSSAPDPELRAAAEAGHLHEPGVLAAQTKRLLANEHTRRLATEFACQWLHLRDFDTLDEKSEQAFPTFAGLRGAMYEETIRFFTDLFQSGGSVLGILEADHTFLTAALAKHYGIPGVSGEEWRRVEGVRRYARGGILTQGTVLAKQSGASRTSPVLRGNWVTETLLGERIPRPPKDVPPLPAEEGAETLTVRQLTEKHSADPRCAGCHARMDPFGFALENFDAIGRFREKDVAGRPVEAHGKLLDGTTLDGVESLREYLTHQRRDAFLRQFNRKLLGFALGRAVQLSDEPLLSEMAERLAANGYRFDTAVEAIVQSRQFRDIRGAQMVADD